METGRKLGENYESAPRPSFRLALVLLFEHERLKGIQGQMLEKL